MVHPKHILSATNLSSSLSQAINRSFLIVRFTDARYTIPYAHWSCPDWPEILVLLLEYS